MQNNKITQENDSHIFAVVSYLQVVDDGDGVPIPADCHGPDPAPGSVRGIELQDVVSVGVATCIVLYYHTNCIGRNKANHEQSPGCHCLYLSLQLYCPEWRPSAANGVREEQQSRSRRWQRGGGVQCCPASHSSNHRSPTEPAPV